MIPRRLAEAASAAALTCLPMLVAVLGNAALPAVAGARSARAAILPPTDPQYSLGIGRYNPSSCSAVTDFSADCLSESLGMINAGRRGEGLGPLVLPANWQALTVAQQLYVLTELERSARGLPVDTGLSADLNSAAARGADAGRDPSGGGMAALWAGGEPNSIVVIADWIYEDGLFASGPAENLNCTSATPSGCWQHRDILLHDGSSGLCGNRCAVGAGYSPSGYGDAAATGTGSDSYAEVFARAASGSETFTWAAELAQLPRCERAGNACTWAGAPVATTSGIHTVGPASKHVPANTRPWFATSVRTRMGHRAGVDRRIHLGLRIRVGIRLRRVTVLAHRGRARIALHVRRLSRFSYSITGRLPAGRWTLRIRYWTLRRGWRRPTSALRVTVP